MASNEKVVIAAVRLRQSEPELWHGFVQGMRDYAAQIAVDMIKAAPEHLHKAQGMAIMANEIAEIIRQAPEIYERNQKLINKKAGTHV